MVQFSRSERHILSLFKEGTRFYFNGANYEVSLSGKPSTSRGEPKTDIYVKSREVGGINEIEFKVSFKQENADFLENKMTAERAEQIFGDNWQKDIYRFTKQIQQSFLSRPYIYKKKYGRTQAGSITLGWRFELQNKQGGDLSDIVDLSIDEVVEVYAGRKLSDNKKNARVNGNIIRNSGVANCVINCDSQILRSAQEAVNHIIPIVQFAQDNHRVYFACKALNYRTFDKKIEGNRSLSVFIDWKIVNGRLQPDLIFNNPLIVKGSQVMENLLDSLDYLGINDTNDINVGNVSSFNYVFH